jgi:hypothetical protein
MTRSSNVIRPTSTPPFRHVSLVEAAGFGVIITVIWLDELLDVPHWLFGESVSPVRVTEAAIESLGVALLATAVIMFTRRLTRRVAYLESYITMCAWCRRVQRNGQWFSIEAYFAEHDAQTSHGICPRCEAEAMGDLTS